MVVILIQTRIVVFVYVKCSFSLVDTGMFPKLILCLRIDHTYVISYSMCS
jgi:hypothetical protein